MKKLLLAAFIFILAATVWCIAQENMRESDVKGGYSECKVYCYEFKNGNIIIQSKRKVLQYIFNEKGKIINEIHYQNDSIIDLRYIYNYNYHENLIEKTLLYPDGRIYKDTIKFDEKGKKLGKPGMPDFTHSEKRQHDEYGNLVVILSYAEDELDSYKYVLKFDKMENLILKEVQDDLNEPFVRWEYIYTK
jgi:hypothetical protein